VIALGYLHAIGLRVARAILVRLGRFAKELLMLGVVWSGGWLLVILWLAMTYFAIRVLPRTGAIMALLVWLWWTTRFARRKLRQRNLERKALKTMAEERQFIIRVRDERTRRRADRRQRQQDPGGVEAMLEQIAEQAAAHVRQVTGGELVSEEAPAPGRLLGRQRRRREPPAAPVAPAALPELRADLSEDEFYAALGRVVAAYQASRR